MRQCTWMFVGLLVWFSLSGTPVSAQEQGPACIGSGDLGCLIPNLYGERGLILPNTVHTAHFLSAFQSNFGPLNGAVASELTRLPIASPASGFTYTFNSATGVFSRSAQSFGPILTERAETIGKGKFYLGFAYQHFSFDSLDGIDLDDIPVVFKHVAISGAPFESDYLTTRNSIDMSLNQFSIFGTYGLTNRFSVSVALPILDVDMKVSSEVTIHRVAPPNLVQFPNSAGEAHYFDERNPVPSTQNTYTSSGNAKGLGDLVIRFKGQVKRWEKSSLAVMADLIAPSGDEHNFLGSGTWGFKPAVAYSMGLGRVAPHFNLGYQINGSSLLVGADITNNRKGHLPNQLSYSFGADVGVTPKVTLAFDYLGQNIFNAEQAVSSTFTSPRPERNQPASATPTPYDTTNFKRSSFNISSASFGLKLNPVGQLLFTGNVLVRLNDGGLRANVAPLFGLSYSF